MIAAVQMPEVDLEVLRIAVEIFILSTAIYAALRFARSTRGSGVLRGLSFFLVIAVVLYAALSWALGGLPVLAEILSQVLPPVVLVLAILFQPELRQGIARFVPTAWLGLGRAAQSQATVAKVAAAAQRMAKERVGALIAFERDVSLAAYRENAVKIEAPLSSILLETIFFPGSPLHDGAVVIRGDEVLAASCLLPLAEAAEGLGRLGTRHRAAIGLTEETDAVTLVVSEETGNIALCAEGQIHRQIPFDQLEDRLRELLRRESRREPGEPAEGKEAAGEESEEATAESPARGDASSSPAKSESLPSSAPPESGAHTA